MGLWLGLNGFPKSLNVSKAIDKSAGEATEEAKEWKGWGTALKPSFEPAVLARKPFKGTVAANVERHGTGALNIDGCRVGAGGHLRWDGRAGLGYMGAEKGSIMATENPLGRWPANVVLDPEAAAILDEQSGESGAGGFPASSGIKSSPGANGTMGDGWAGQTREKRVNTDTGGASRFFYVAKPSAKDRWTYCKDCRVAVCRTSDDKDEHKDHETVTHPTQKPVALMEWLIKLVTPPGGVVMDPFCGSGTTAVAAKGLGVDFITCDLSEDYTRLAEARLAIVGVAEHVKPSSGYFCLGCRKEGRQKLIPTSIIDKAEKSGRKISCPKCFSRFTPAELKA